MLPPNYIVMVFICIYSTADSGEAEEVAVMCHVAHAVTIQLRQWWFFNTWDSALCKQPQFLGFSPMITYV